MTDAEDDGNDDKVLVIVHFLHPAYVTCLFIYVSYLKIGTGTR